MMTNGDPKLKNSELLLMTTLAILAMALITIAVVPQLRLMVKNKLFGFNREIIAKVEGDITPTGPHVTVLKIKTHSSLFLEIFTPNEDKELTLLTKIPLYETRDGHFFIKGNATNLALTDVDNDGQLDIVAPTYDEQMVPRLNIFRYNKETQSFDRVTAPEGFEKNL